jgi:hypothetical protein
MATDTTLANLAQQLTTIPVITRVAASIVAIPAIIFTPFLLMCQHPVPIVAAVVNLASIGATLKTGEPSCLLQALGITGGIICYNHMTMTYDSLDMRTNRKKNDKKPPRIALQVESYVQPH